MHYICRRVYELLSKAMMFLIVAEAEEEAEAASGM